MTTKDKREEYINLKDNHPPMYKCFFAFSTAQFNEGMKNIEESDTDNIYKTDFGLYGTQEGLDKFFEFYRENSNLIGKTVEPQIAYDYEYENFECGYVCEDTEAIKQLFNYYTLDQIKTIKRKNAFYNLKECFL